MKLRRDTTPCPECNGSGNRPLLTAQRRVMQREGRPNRNLVHDIDRKCKSCKGKGRVPKK